VVLPGQISVRTELSCFQTINILNSNNLAFKSAFKGVSDR